MFETRAQGGGGEPTWGDVVLKLPNSGIKHRQNKKEAAIKFGKEQVQIWRRSFDVPPPNGESLEMTYNRTIPYFKNNIII